MSILIKGMEMPKSCYFCEMYEADLYWCSAAKRDIDSFDDYDNRSSFCPLTPVPAHGRLIDADKAIENIMIRQYALKDRTGNVDSGLFTRDIERCIKEQPTLSPADVRPVVRGKWHDWYHVLMPDCYVATCSNCGKAHRYLGMKLLNYCPNCGARMDGDGE